ncbi:hypothetical protein HYV49_04005, partial [Candidatus Pacearchaeota archaeon]|nr:hypothetical protein [Candidatus Pacearchaeota archaeon]
EYKGVVDKVNERLNRIQDATANKELGTVNADAATKQYRDELLKDYSSALNNRLGPNYREYINQATLSELRDLERDLLLSEQVGVQELGLRGIVNINKTLQARYDSDKAFKELEQLTQGLQATSISFRDDAYAPYYGGEWNKQLNDSFKGGNINTGDKVQFITV